MGGKVIWDKPQEKPSDSIKTVLIQFTKHFGTIGLVLYVLGYAVISLHLAGFGIIANDILSIRYAIAGFWAALGLAGGAYAIHIILGYLPKSPRAFFVEKKVWFRSLAILITVPYNLSIAYGLNLIYRAFDVDGIVAAAAGPLIIKSDPLGQLALQVVNFFGPNPGTRFVFANWIPATLYGFAVITFWKLISSLANRYSVEKKTSPETAGTKRRLTKTHDEAYSARPWYSTYIDCAVILFVCTVLAYSLSKIRNEGLYTASFRVSELSVGLVFAWLNSYVYFGIIFSYVVRATGLFKIERIKEEIKDPSSMQSFVTMLILPIMLAIANFGHAIYPRISFSMGGGSARPISLKTETSEISGFLISEDSHSLYIINNSSGRNEVYQIPRSELKSAHLLK